MTTIVLLTGNEKRHEFFRKFLGSSKNIKIKRTYCEEGSKLKEMVEKEKNGLRSTHLILRDNSERDFFEVFCKRVDDNSNAIQIPRGSLNNPEIVNEIISHAPDLIISYGCSIVKSELIDLFQGRFINVHLGLSPYYRGSGTNFWPFVNGESHMAGITFMHLDRGIDTGKIIHQIRARIFEGDDIHKIGNRLIADGAATLEEIILNFKSLETAPSNFFPKVESKVYRNSDFTEESINQLNAIFKKGLYKPTTSQIKEMDNVFPIFKNKLGQI